MSKGLIGVIGGSGFYQIDGLTDIEEIAVETPFGPPSDKIILGTLESKKVAFLPRHGKGHRLIPREVASRANIMALKMLGVEKIIAVSAVGSLREDYAPLDIVIPDQLVDNTKLRQPTFFGEGIVVHISMADPFCTELNSLLYAAAKKVGVNVHNGGTYICIEGPQFSTRAESRIYRQWGMDIIGMTAIPEAKLAREAEICYSMIALVTDYDVWHISEEPVTNDMVIKNMALNVGRAKEILKETLKDIHNLSECSCNMSLAEAIMTPKDQIGEDVKKKLFPIIKKYL